MLDSRKRREGFPLSGCLGFSSELEPDGKFPFSLNNFQLNTGNGEKENGEKANPFHRITPLLCGFYFSSPPLKH